MDAATYAMQRDRMVAEQIERRGVADTAVLRALRDVPRHEFVPEYVGLAYDDRALPIALGQTISQPYIVALTVAALELRGGEVVLDVGTGSGYAAAVAARIAGRVISIERHAALAETARGVLTRLNYDNVEIEVGDGSVGLPSQAPYDAIMVAAAAPAIAEPLIEQLRVGGRLVMPIGENEGNQELLQIVRTGEGNVTRHLCPVRFVPLIGAGGF